MAKTPVNSRVLDDEAINRLADEHRFVIEVDEEEAEEAATEDQLASGDPQDLPDLIFCDTATEVAAHLVNDYEGLDDEEAYMQRAEMLEAVAFLMRKKRFNEAMDDDPQFAQLAAENDDLVTAYNTEDAVLVDGEWPEELPALMVSTASYEDASLIPKGNVEVIDPYTEVGFVRGMAAAGLVALRENVDAVRDED